MTTTSERVPSALLETLEKFVGPLGCSAVTRWMRDPNDCMTPEALSAIKPSRVSLAPMMMRHILRLGSQIERILFACEADGGATARYAICIGESRMTYVVRSFPWDGKEKVGRRADGVTRDMFSALFLGEPEEARIKRELTTFEEKDRPNSAYDAVFGLGDVDRLRTDADLIGWIPANRSVDSFESIVNALASGRQPHPATISQNSGYILRNAGFLGSGRNGTLSFSGFPADHPLRHPYFAEAFGLYLIRMFSIDLVNGTAAARSNTAVELDPDIARVIGVGNSSGQGMCVALQRWPHWVATWISVRELTIAYAKSRPAYRDNKRFAAILSRLELEAQRHREIRLQSDEFVVSPRLIADNLMRLWGELTRKETRENLRDSCWGEVLAPLTRGFDPETIEEINSILIDAYPDFADAASAYYPVGMVRMRDYDPTATVREFRETLRKGYAWALRQDLTNSKTRRTFWYHSAEGGEQRRGNRGEDPHEEFESFIDVVGTMQRIASTLSAYPEHIPLAEVVADNPDLHFGISRAHTLSAVPYAEIRGNLSHEDFAPAHLIRFFLSILGMEFSSPLSKRYVRGVFLQGAPLREELSRGAFEESERA